MKTYFLLKLKSYKFKLGISMKEKKVLGPPKKRSVAYMQLNPRDVVIPTRDLLPHIEDNETEEEKSKRERFMQEYYTVSNIRKRETIANRHNREVAVNKRKQHRLFTKMSRLMNDIGNERKKLELHIGGDKSDKFLASHDKDEK